MFSQTALESYLTRLQDVVKGEISKWCAEAGPVEVYTATRSLTFRIAVRVLLGLKLDERRITHLSKTFEQLMNNLFSLPVDAPLSGLRKVRKHISMNQINLFTILMSNWRNAFVNLPFMFYSTLNKHKYIFYPKIVRHFHKLEVTVARKSR